MNFQGTQTESFSSLLFRLFKFSVYYLAGALVMVGLSYRYSTIAQAEGSWVLYVAFSTFITLNTASYWDRDSQER